MRTLFAAALLALAVPVQAKGKAKAAAYDGTASTSTVKMVRFFVDTATTDLPPEAVPDFLAVDAKTLPAKLREPYEAKKTELLALKKVADGRKKPPLRRLGMDAPPCEPPKRAPNLRLYFHLGFTEVDDEELRHLMSDTSCTECELQAESSLTVVLTPPAKKGGQEVRHSLFLEEDPMMVLIGGYRAGRKSSSGTNFFGINMTPKCR